MNVLVNGRVKRYENYVAGEGINFTLSTFFQQGGHFFVLYLGEVFVKGANT